MAPREIIGWLISHFVSPDCLRYAKFWVDPGWERSGAPLAMLASVMRSAHFSQDADVFKRLLYFPPQQSSTSSLGRQTIQTGQ